MTAPPVTQFPSIVGDDPSTLMPRGQHHHVDAEVAPSVGRGIADATVVHVPRPSIRAAVAHRGIRADVRDRAITTGRNKRAAHENKVRAGQTVVSV